MITLKSKREIELLKEAGHIVYLTHQYLRPHIKAGIKTIELDRLAEDFIRSKGATPSFKGYEGFPYTLCISINDEVVHGFPSERTLKDGDIISIDIGACYKGYNGDSAWTYQVGEISNEAKYLLEHTEKALYEGIKQAKVGNRIGDISAAVEKYATKHNLGVVKELVENAIDAEARRIDVVIIDEIRYDSEGEELGEFPVDPVVPVYTQVLRLVEIVREQDDL